VTGQTGAQRLCKYRPSGDEDEHDPGYGPEKTWLQPG
jgi:hypothetical protein